MEVLCVLDLEWDWWHWVMRMMCWRLIQSSCGAHVAFVLHYHCICSHNLFNNSFGWGKNNFLQNNFSQRWTEKAANRKGGAGKFSGSKHFHQWFLKMQKMIYLFNSRDTSRPHNICLCRCGLSDTTLLVHTPEPGRWSVTHSSTLLICNVVFCVCVRVRACMRVVKWGVISSEPGRPQGKKIAFCSLWKVLVVWKSLIIPPVSSEWCRFLFRVV